MFNFSASIVHFHTHLYVRMFMHHVSIIARDVGRNNCAGAGAGHCILHCCCTRLLHDPVSANDAVMEMENNELTHLRHQLLASQPFHDCVDLSSWTGTSSSDWDTEKHSDKQFLSVVQAKTKLKKVSYFVLKTNNYTWSSVSANNVRLTLCLARFLFSLATAKTSW